MSEHRYFILDGELRAIVGDDTAPAWLAFQKFRETFPVRGMEGKRR